MKRADSYNTRQREAILGFINSLEGSHITAAQIVAHFASGKTPIGRTTVYRHLDRLTKTGTIRKYTTDGITAACYQQTDNCAHHETHLHLKCDGCGELLHLECDTLSELQHHVLKEHAFEVNTLKTVFYGRCEDCLHRA